MNIFFGLTYRANGIFIYDKRNNQIKCIALSSLWLYIYVVWGALSVSVAYFCQKRSIWPRGKSIFKRTMPKHTFDQKQMHFLFISIVQLLDLVAANKIFGFCTMRHKVICSEQSKKQLNLWIHILCSLYVIFLSLSLSRSRLLFFHLLLAQTRSCF